VFIVLLGIPAVLTGLLRILGGFAFQERLGRRWTLDGTTLGTLELALGVLLLGPRGVDPDLLVPITAAWGAVSGILLLTQGLQLRRVARTWQASSTAPQDPQPATLVISGWSPSRAAVADRTARECRPQIAAGASPKEVAGPGRAHLDQLRARPLRPPVPESDAALRDRLDALFVPMTEQRRNTTA
jgi:hypothetical protein